LTDLLTGRIDFMFIDAVAGVPQIQARKVKVLAIAAPQRMAALPDVPTVAEEFPSVDIQAWQAIAAPKGTPTAVVQKLNTGLNRLLETDEVRTTLLRYGVTANPMSMGALNTLIGKDEKRFGELVRAAGLSPS
jgi:tripartite-type tricarboxylate transporter receptor subunit TctC